MQAASKMSRGFPRWRHAAQIHDSANARCLGRFEKCPCPSCLPFRVVLRIVDRVDEIDRSITTCEGGRDGGHIFDIEIHPTRLRPFASIPRRPNDLPVGLSERGVQMPANETGCAREQQLLRRLLIMIHGRRTVACRYPLVTP